MISCKHLSQFTVSVVPGESLLITLMLQPPVNTVISKTETETNHKSGKPWIPLCLNLYFPGKIFYNWSAIEMNMVVANMWQKIKKLGRCCQTFGDPAVNLKQPHEAGGRKSKGGGQKNLISAKGKSPLVHSVSLSAKATIQYVNNTLCPRWENSFFLSAHTSRITVKLTYRYVFPSSALIQREKSNSAGSSGRFGQVKMPNYNRGPRPHKSNPPSHPI